MSGCPGTGTQGGPRVFPWPTPRSPGRLPRRQPVELASDSAGSASATRWRARNTRVASVPSPMPRARAASRYRRPTRLRRVLLDLGATLRAAGQRTAAREPLLEALALGARCGARTLDTPRAAASRRARARFVGRIPPSHGSVDAMRTRIPFVLFVTGL